MERLRRISLSSFDPSTLTFPNDPFNDPIPESNSLLLTTTQDAVHTASNLSTTLSLEPRPIEQMRADPLDVEASFAGLWPTEV